MYNINDLEYKPTKGTLIGVKNNLLVMNVPNVDICMVLDSLTKKETKDAGMYGQLVKVQSLETGKLYEVSTEWWELSKDEINEKVISDFHGEMEFLSNFYDKQPITYKGLTYLNNEAAFQAQKTNDIEVRKKFQSLNPSQAKKLGRNRYVVELVEDWEQTKYNIMYEICKEKFKNKELREKLLSTGNLILIEGNYWHDNDWGYCTCDKCKEKEKNNNLGINY